MAAGSMVRYADEMVSPTCRGICVIGVICGETRAVCGVSGLDPFNEGAAGRPDSPMPCLPQSTCSTRHFRYKVSGMAQW